MNLARLFRFLIALSFISTIGLVTWFMLHSDDGQKISEKSPLIHNPDVISAPIADIQTHDEHIEKVEVVAVVEKPQEVVEAKPVDIDLKDEVKAENPEEENKKPLEPELKVEEDDVPDADRPPSVHIFYYPWYGDVQNDGKYFHWDHRVFWNRELREGDKVRHDAPGDIASVYYPQLGAYSSRDALIIDKHFQWMKFAKIDVVAVSWYPVGAVKYSWEDLMPTFLDFCSKYNMKLAFHLEPYTNRTALSVKNDLEYLVKNYGAHPAFYRTKPKVGDKLLPAVYVYDSYLVHASEWQKITKPESKDTIRGTPYDAILIGLALRQYDIPSMKAAGFDGVYTYFAADGFTQASSKQNWKKMAKLCRENGMLFVPSIGPGYDDSRVRPWNGENTRTRNDGKYYVEHFEAAYQAKPDILSITSFNEWHEGTQIEPAVAFTDKMTNFSYPPYENGTDFYLHLTKTMIEKYFNKYQRLFKSREDEEEM